MGQAGDEFAADGGGEEGECEVGACLSDSIQFAGRLGVVCVCLGFDPGNLGAGGAGAASMIVELAGLVPVFQVVGWACEGAGLPKASLVRASRCPGGRSLATSLATSSSSSMIWW